MSLCNLQPTRRHYQPTANEVAFEMLVLLKCTERSVSPSLCHVCLPASSSQSSQGSSPVVRIQNDHDSSTITAETLQNKMAPPISCVLGGWRPVNWRDVDPFTLLRVWGSWSLLKVLVLERLVGQMFLGKDRFSFPVIYEFMKIIWKKRRFFSLFRYFHSYHYHFKIPFTFILGVFFFNIYTCKFPKMLQLYYKNSIFCTRSYLIPPPPPTIPFFFLMAGGSCFSSEPKLHNSHSNSTGCYKNSHIFPVD